MNMYMNQCGDARIYVHMEDNILQMHMLFNLKKLYFNNFFIENRLKLKFKI